MLFNKNFQAINSFQTNNSGNDVSIQLNELAMDNMFDLPDVQENILQQTETFISLASLNSPDIERSRWLNNHINMLNSNVLQKLNNGLEVKGSLSYINDYQKVNGYTSTTLFTPGQIIDVTENVDNGYNTNDLRGKITILKNDKKIYLKNSFSISKKWSSDIGNLLRNDESIEQQKALSDMHLLNKLSVTTFIGKKLITFNSLMSYIKTPQKLSVSPGQFEDILNDSTRYSKTQQDVNYTYFTTDNYFSFVKSIKGVTVISRLGTLLQNQQLNSDLYLQTEPSNLPNNSYINQILLRQQNIYLDLKCQYVFNSLKISLAAPLTYRNILVDDRIQSTKHRLRRLTIEPDLYINYRLSNLWETNLSSAYRKEYGRIATLYTGYILNTYSSLQKFNSIVPESGIWDNRISFNYKNVSQSKFINITYNYHKEKREFIFGNTIDGNGFTSINLLQVPNVQEFHRATADYNKFLNTIKTIFKIKGEITLGKANYVLNNILSLLKTTSGNINISINNNSSNFFSVKYSTQFSLVKNRLENRKLDNVYVNNHTLELNFFPINNHMLSVKPEYYITGLKTEKNQFFLDAKYRLTFPKKKIEIEVIGNNLLNTNQFIRLINNEFSIVKSYFNLRQRQVWASIKFNF